MPLRKLLEAVTIFVTVFRDYRVASVWFSQGLDLTLARAVPPVMNFLPAFVACNVCQLLLSNWVINSIHVFWHYCVKLSLLNVPNKEEFPVYFLSVVNGLSQFWMPLPYSLSKYGQIKQFFGTHIDFKWIYYIFQLSIGNSLDKFT